MKLRKLLNTDFDLLLRLLTDSRVRRYLGGALATKEAIGRVEQLLRNKPDDYWVIEAESVSVGTVILSKHIDSGKAEISYQLLPEWTGKGLAFNAVRAILTTTSHSRVVAETQAKNVRSRKLLEKLGFQEAARLKRYGETQIYYEYYRAASALHRRRSDRSR